MNEVNNSRDLRLHRKYILVICFILLFLKIGGIEVDKLEFLGASITFQNHHAVYLGLWVILFYSIFRYYQYFTHEAKGPVTSEFMVLKNAIFTKKLDKIIDKEIYPAWRHVNPSNGQPYDPIQYYHLKKASLFRKTLLANSYKVAVDNEVNQQDSFTLEEITLSFDIHEIRDFWKQHLKTYWHFVFTTPYFFEYFFPPILALTTLLYCHTDCWEGSFFRVIIP